jgi:hypothetical protein
MNRASAEKFVSAAKYYGLLGVAADADRAAAQPYGLLGVAAGAAGGAAGAPASFGVER